MPWNAWAGKLVRIVGVTMTACFSKFANSLHLPLTFAEAVADSRTGEFSSQRNVVSMVGLFQCNQTKYTPTSQEENPWVDTNRK